MELVRHLRLSKRFVVWRGLNNFNKNGYYDEINNLHKTKIINNYPFISTSVSKEVAKNFAWGILLKIYIDPFEDLNYIALENNLEKEILFQPNTHFKWVGEYMENDNKIIEVELKNGIVNSSAN